MKIGIDITCLKSGRGPARYTREIVTALSQCCQMGDEFILYSPFDTGIEGLPTNFSYRHLPQQKHWPWLNWTLPCAARKDRLNVMFFPANDCWLWKAVPTVVALLDVAQFTTLYYQLPSWKDRLQIRFQMGRTGRVAQKIITISNYSAGQIHAVVPGSKGKTEVVYCGLSDVFYGQGSTGADPVPYILFVSGFDRRKNLERLLQAYKILREKGREEKFLLVGSGGANQRLYYDMPALVKQYGLEHTVEIRNNVDDQALIGLYSHASLCVLPSIVEGFGFTVIEAQACGCPVVCSNAASIPEVGGDAAVYFDPLNVGEMAHSMEKVLSDRTFADELRKKGKVNSKRFSWDKAGKRVYELLATV
ncbi:MAG: glycosyltransferase family 4 protein [Fibrobacter sp.]|nr:glycosyltransferase family 4 protein [Fibrobacter sp.]